MKDFKLFHGICKKIDSDFFRPNNSCLKLKKIHLLENDERPYSQKQQKFFLLVLIRISNRIFVLIGKPLISCNER